MHSPRFHREPTATTASALHSKTSIMKPARDKSEGGADGERSNRRKRCV